MERKVVNNAFYEDLGNQWYEANNHPIALLRAENKTRAPWVAQVLSEHYSKPCQLLDIGCGAGFLSNALAEKGHVVWGIDLSSNSLEVAKRFDKTSRVKYQTADATQLPFPSQTFDAACAMDLLEHVENPLQVIQEASRVLKPGGLFFFHTFNRTWLSWLFAVKGLEWFIPNTPSHVHLYRYFIKPTEIEKYLTDSSLQIKEMKGFMPAFNKSFLQLLLRRGIPENFTFKKIDSLKCGYVGYAVKR